MKKQLLLALGLGLMAGSVYAACSGPFCFDDTGASVNGYAYTGNGVGIPAVSSVTVQAVVPNSTNQLVRCTNCVTSGNFGYLCISTGTVPPAYVFATSTGSVCK